MAYDARTIELTGTDRENIRVALTLLLERPHHGGRAPSQIRNTLNKLRWAESDPRGVLHCPSR